MADTILDQIIDKLVLALKTITVANGYNTEVVSVYEPATIAGSQRPPSVTFSVELVQGDEVRNDDWAAAGNPPLVGWDVVLPISMIYRPSDKETDPIRHVLNLFWADVTKVLQADPLWDGLALDTNIGDPVSFIDAADGYVGKTAITVITYRHYENDPYTQP